MTQRLRSGTGVAVFVLCLAATACKGGGSSDGSSNPGQGGAGGGPGSGSGGGSGMAVNADLVAVNIVPVQTSLEAGQSTAVSLLVRNDGPDAVPGFRVAAYLSGDSALDAGDPRLGTWTSAGLAAGQSFQTSGVVQVPVQTAIGDYRLLVEADDQQELAETSETNNVAVSAEVLQVAEATHPDLVVDSVGFGPGSVQAGETIDVSDTVRNDGVEASGSFRVGIYLSADATVTSADLMIGQRSVSSLAVGASSNANGLMTVPVFVPAGTYFVGAVADDLGAVVEMDESNNGRAANATLSVSAAPLPDLAPSAVSFSPMTVDAGQPIVVENTVINQGVATSALFQVGVYLSTDATIDPSEDVLIGTRSITTLAVGNASSSGPTALTIPGNTQGGDWFVGVYVDAGELVPEIDEGNNTLLAASRVTITVPPLPDLAVQSFAFSPQIVSAGSGATLTVTDDIANLGVANSAPVRVALYLSADAAVTTNDILLGTHTLGALVPGGAAGLTVSMPVPGGIPTGSYRVGLWVDDDQQQPEIDEGNNLFIATALLDVTGGGPAQPNLVSELIDPASMLVAPGGSFQVVTRIGNQGDASTPPFRIGVYLSTDPTIEATDILLGDRFVPFGLGSGFTSVASAPVTVPVGTPEGMYTIGVLADWQDVVAESNESDNTLTETMPFEVRVPPPPRPNLVVSEVSVTATGNVQPGDVLDVAHTVRNVGEVDAGAFRVGIYLSDDATIDTADTLLATRVLSGLNFQASDGTTTAVQIPAQTAAGSWFIGVFVDDQGAVEESDEGDNGLARTPALSVQ